MALTGSVAPSSDPAAATPATTSCKPLRTMNPLRPPVAPTTLPRLTASADGVERHLIAVTSDLVQADLVAALPVEIGDVAGEAPPSAGGLEVTDDAGQRAVDGNHQIPRCVAGFGVPGDRAGEHERRRAIGGRELLEQVGLLERRF